MVMAQDPSSCWWTSRWPGMTDEETARTGELLLSIAARARRCSSSSTTWSSCGSIARTVTVLHEGSVLCEGPVEQVQQDERVLRSTSAGAASKRGARMLEVAGLDVAYGESQVLWDVVARRCRRAGGLPHGPQRRGQDHAAKTIMGLLPVRARARRASTAPTSRGWRPERAGARCGIGYVPQGREIFPHLTCEENLRMALLGCGRGGTATATSTTSSSCFPSSSGCWAARAACCRAASSSCSRSRRALLARPKLLLMDEPTEGIQPSIIDEIEDAIERIKASGASRCSSSSSTWTSPWRLADAYAIMGKGSHRGAGRDRRPAPTTWSGST